MHPKQMALLGFFYACVLILTTLTMAQTNTNRTYTISKGANVTKPGCPKQCGNVTVPYPFGIGSGCALDSGFVMDCDTSDDGSGKLPLIGNIEVYDISDAELRVKNVIGQRCYNSNGTMYYEFLPWTKFSESNPYTFSALNRFIVVGCDDYASITGPNNFEYGCNTSCISSGDVMKGVCMGKGCCQKHIPKGLKYYNTTMSSKGNHSHVSSFSQCGYAFLGEADEFHFRGITDLSDDNFIDRTKATVSIVLDWAIGTHTCMQAQENEDYACRENSQCVDTDLHGYRCICKPGFQGNPYLGPGCQGIGRFPHAHT